MEILNRKARYDYEILETVEAGMVLTGTEIKSLRAGKAHLKDSYAIVRKNECYLLNMHISPYEQGNIFNHEETRTRKLLLHKKEIYKLRDQMEQDGVTLVPLKIYLLKNRAKVLLGIARGKKNYDKREAIKKKDIEREVQKELKKY